MEFVKLTEAQQHAFDENGYLVVPNAISPEMVDQLTEVSNQIVDSHERNGYYVQIRPGIVEEPRFWSLLAHSSTVPLVTQLLSPNIQLHTTAIIYKFPQPVDVQSIKERGWHRDAGISDDLGHKNQPRVGIKVGYCLTDFSETRSGFTLFASGSHLLQTPLPIPKGEVDPPDTVELCLNPGDAFLFENRLFHTSAPNLSDCVSKVIILGYTYRWMGGRREAMAVVQPDESVLSQVDAIVKQLMGGPSEGLIEWAREHDVMPEPIQWVMEV